MRSSVAILFLLAAIGLHGATPAFHDLDQRARAGEKLNVIFFGASLTWGANASDPLLTSYRAHIARRMEAQYPQAHFTFWDAAIGGTGSQLGVFRLERDVLRRRPDLVVFNGTNTYSGPTTISAGMLTLGAAALLTNTPAIFVASNATFNVVAVTGGFTLQPNQTLSGFGTVTGVVTSAGTLSPGASLGTITFTTNLTLTGTTFLELDKSQLASNDVIQVLGVLTAGGTLQVTNVGPLLAAGDTFKLFGGFQGSIQNGVQFKPLVSAEAPSPESSSPPTGERSFPLSRWRERVRVRVVCPKLRTAPSQTLSPSPISPASPMI